MAVVDAEGNVVEDFHIGDDVGGVSKGMPAFVVVVLRGIVVVVVIVAVVVEVVLMVDEYAEDCGVVRGVGDGDQVVDVVFSNKTNKKG